MKITEEKIKNAFEAYENGKEYKNNIGDKGLFTQNKINERFYRGDQWKGCKAGNLPLIIQNVIKRIGEYKISNITSNSLSVIFSAEGIPNTIGIREDAKAIMDLAAEGVRPQELSLIPSAEEISFVCDAISSYFKISAERLKFDMIKERAAKKAYIGGTAILHTYWDEKILTGLYADNQKELPITGDINIELIDAERFYPADPTEENIQNQESIIIASRDSVQNLKREATANGMPKTLIDEIKSETADVNYMAGDMSETEIAGNGRCTVLTKYQKIRNKQGKITVYVSKFTQSAVIKDETNTGLENYPFSVYKWEDIEGSFFGDSEVTHLVPNQIAINRLLSACVWNAILCGMPITVVNNNVINTKETPITNEPGQIIGFNGENDFRNAIGYVTPPSISGEFFGIGGNLIDNTLKHSGANDAALGDLRPDNTSAIIAVREAAQQPLQPKLTRFYQFIEDTARIWAEYWFKFYGERKIKMEDDRGIWYLSIDGDRYKDLVISAKVDIGPSSLWSELQTISTLDALLDRGIINVIQYLERMPQGYIPEAAKLIEELKATEEAKAAQELEKAQVEELATKAMAIHSEKEEGAAI